MRILASIALFMLAVSAVSAQTSPSPIAAPANVAAPPADATKTASGLATKVVKPGTGTTHPAKDDVVTVDYTAWTPDGKMLDSTVERGKPVTLQVKKMLPGMSEGVQQMVTGETSMMWIPQSLTYKGQQGKPVGTLVFQVTLDDIPTRAPADVKGLPPTPSGPRAVLPTRC